VRARFSNRVSANDLALSHRWAATLLDGAKDSPGHYDSLFAEASPDMKKSVFVTAGMTTTVSAVIVFESVVAHAVSPPNVTGLKYSDASSALTEAGYSIVVSTTVGDTVNRPDCVVTRQQGRTEPAPENTTASPVSQMLLSLNCGAPVATAVTPGNSRQSPDGRAAAAKAEKANATPTPSK
jgi:hypothetical protein